jgi:hypothetical protein
MMKGVVMMKGDDEVRKLNSKQIAAVSLNR